MRLKVLFIPTWGSGVTFYRMYNFWKAAERSGLADVHVLWWQKDKNEPHSWQREVHDPNFMWRITKEMNDWFMQSDITIIGTLSGPGAKVVANKESSSEYVANALGVFLGLVDVRDNHYKEKVILTECDDNVISTPEYNPAYKFFTPESEVREITLTQFKHSDGLIVSTPYLKEIYTEFNSNCHVIPNCIDFKMWDNLPKRSKKGIRIGWGGGANHEEDLRVLTDVIPAIVKDHKDVKFVFLHGCPEYLRKLPGVEFNKKWTEIDKWPKYLASQDFDIGIAPLVDNAFNRAKSNLKWLEYSALKIPTVASNVGHYKQTITLGTDALLVNTAAEWVNALRHLIKNKSERRSIALAANETVRKSFNIDNVIKTYVEVLKNERLKRQISNMVTETVQ